VSISIQTNVDSLVAQQNLNVNNQFQSKTIQQLTSGYRINEAGDDAAGLAVANQFTNSVSELTQGVANGNDGVAQLQIMDGGMSNIAQILDRLQTLSTQSASGTFTGDRATLNQEFQTDLQEIDRQAQSIGLNAGGTFNQNLNVYLGEGSGSQSLSNGIVTLSLAGSAVDSQSLGLKGMEAVNLTSGSLSGTNAGVDLGPSSATSVQNIVSNTTGGSANQEAVAGYAQFYFSGAGFSDNNKIGVSVNLAGVTDTTTLANAINSAIQTAANGTTAAATAFQNAGIVASVHTDTQGGQELAFSSSTSAFQVQAGDQMANALLGNVTNVGTVANPIAQGAAVASTAATTVTGQNTSAGAGFAVNQAVNMVITGGGLAGPVTLTLNTTAQVATNSAIADLENEFAGNAALAAAGLSMHGSTTPGSPLSFTSATGQSFNIQVTGDTANLLGLGSFAAGNTGQAAYSTVTGPAAYNSATTFGNADFEISLNGQASTALTAVNLATGASALAASVTGSAVGSPAAITGFTGTDTVTVNSSSAAHPFATQTAIALTATHAATSGEVAGTLASGGITYGAALNGLTMQLKVDGGSTQTVTLAGSGADSSANALLDDMNSQLAAFGAHAFFDAGNGGLLTIASNTAGANSSVQLMGGNAEPALGLTTNGTFSGTAASASLQDIAGQIQTALGANAAVSVVNGNQLQIASVNKGAGETFTVSATAGAGAGLGLTTGVAHTGTSSSTQDIVNNLNAQFAASSQWLAAGLQASATLANGTGSGNYVTISSSNGTQFRLNALSGAGTANVGFGNSGVSFTGAAPSSTGTAMASLAAYGISQSGAQSFTAMKYGDDKQALTFSAMDNNGVLETKTITLANNASTNTAGANIDSAVAYINQQLQESTGTPALQQIVAVAQNVGGQEKINFVSSLSNFTVGVAGTANADGVNGGAATQVSSQSNGSGANMSIDTQANAEAAVAAVTTAVSKLGTAQAAVGIGENQLNYAVNLASSQITNYSAAEAQIRDADVAQQAANLTKAQVLQQAAIAAMAQANSSPQAVLKLLQT
jgi:flagellin